MPENIKSTEQQSPSQDTQKEQFVSKQLSYPLDHNSAKIIETAQLRLKYPHAYWRNRGLIYVVKVFDDSTTLTTGDGKVIVPIPIEFDATHIIHVEAFLSTVSSSGAITVQLRNVTDSVDILSTAITIDQSEFNSKDAATPFVINFTNAQLAHGDRIAVDVDGAGTGAKGLAIKFSAI
jgi:hypothetical protein